MLILQHSPLTIHSLPQAKGHHLGRENSSAPLTTVFCNLVTYLQTYGKALQQHKQQYPHFLNEADRLKERLHFQLLWLQHLLCPGLVHRALPQQHAGCSQWDSIEAKKKGSLSCYIVFKMYRRQQNSQANFRISTR